MWHLIYTESKFKTRGELKCSHFLHSHVRYRKSSFVVEAELPVSDSQADVSPHSLRRIAVDGHVI